MTHGIGSRLPKSYMKRVDYINYLGRKLGDLYEFERMWLRMWELRAELRNEVSWYSTWTMTTL